MKWGRQWGNYWGDVHEAENVKMRNFNNTPPVAIIEWDEFLPDALYNLSIDGKSHDITAELSTMAQFQEEGRHYCQVFISGPGNLDEDMEKYFDSIPGCRAKLTWTASDSSDIDHYDIYWDEGEGGDIDTYLDSTTGNDTQYVTSELDNGTYYFRVDAVDTAGNRNESSSSVSVVIATYPEPPSDLEITGYDSGTGDASFSFTQSPTAGFTNYRVYHNGGSGEIDYDTIIDTVDPEDSTFDINLPGAGEYKLGIRAYDGSNEEDNIDVYIEFELAGVTVELLTEPPNIPEAFTVMPAAGGTFTLRCNYNAFEELTKGVTVYFYKNDGAGGAIDYNTADASAAITDHTTGELAIFALTATSSVLVDGNTYLWAAKTANSADRESDATSEVSAVADSTEPNDIADLAGTAVRFEE